MPRTQSVGQRRSASEVLIDSLRETRASEKTVRIAEEVIAEREAEQNKENQTP
jgi:hypothetical protein